MGGGEKKEFIIYIQLNDFAIRDVDDGLACSGKTISLFGIHDGPGFIKSVNEGAVLMRWGTLFKIASETQIIIAQ